MNQAKEFVVVGLVGLALLVLGVVIGRVSKDPVVQAVEVVKWKEKIVWEKKESVASETTATAAKSETVRVVTRWLRADGTTLKEQERLQLSTGAVSVASQTDSSSASQGETDRVSESRTVVELRPRFHAQAYLGLDLGAGAARRWGGAVSVRIAGPIHVGAWALPGMKLYGAAVGVTW